MKSASLIDGLTAELARVLTAVERFRGYALEDLCWREHAGAWTILECLEHLNLYGDFYLPRIAARIAQCSRGSTGAFNSGLLGAFLAKSMLPTAKMRRLRTFRDKDPMHAGLDKGVLDRFVAQQQQLLGLLQASRGVDINGLRVATSISSLLRLKLGDVFQFMVNHIARHMHQIAKIEEAARRAGVGRWGQG